MSDVTHILQAIDAGDPKAADELLPLVYEELRRLAVQKMAHERAEHTVDATGLVHEAYLRLIGDQKFEDRRHFFAAEPLLLKGYEGLKECENTMPPSEALDRLVEIYTATKKPDEAKKWQVERATYPTSNKEEKK